MASPVRDPLEQAYCLRQGTSKRDEFRRGCSCRAKVIHYHRPGKFPPDAAPCSQAVGSPGAVGLGETIAFWGIIAGSTRKGKGQGQEVDQWQWQGLGQGGPWGR